MRIYHIYYKTKKIYFCTFNLHYITSGILYLKWRLDQCWRLVPICLLTLNTGRSLYRPLELQVDKFKLYSSYSCYQYSSIGQLWKIEIFQLVCRRSHSNYSNTLTDIHQCKYLNRVAVTLSSVLSKIFVSSYKTNKFNFCKQTQIRNTSL